MECLIPLSVLAKLQKYGIKPHKPYNDAKKLLPEKYELSIVEDQEVGKAIRIEEEDELLKFLSYFVEELLGRGEVVGQRVTYEGVPFEKYEALMERIIELEKDNSVNREKLVNCEKLTKLLEKDLETCRKENESLKAEVEGLQSKLRSLEEEKRKQEILKQINKLKEVAANLPKGSPERTAVEEAVKTLEKQI
jgi:chromosome segregation ATPase